MIKNVIPQMFDVRPLNKNGDLDVEKIKKVKKTERQFSELKPERKIIKNIQTSSQDILTKEKKESYFPKNFLQKEANIGKNRLEIFDTSPTQFVFKPLKEKEKKDFILKTKPLRKKIKRQNIKRNTNDFYFQPKPFKKRKEKILVQDDGNDFYFQPKVILEERREDLEKNDKENAYIPTISSYIPPNDCQLLPLPKENEVEEDKISIFSAISSKSKNFLEEFKDEGVYEFGFRRPAISFAKASFLVFILFFSINYVYKGLSIKQVAEKEGKAALINLVQAKEGIEERDFNKSAIEFSEAGNRFDEIFKNLNNLGSIILETSRFIPYASKLSSGKYLAQSGKDIAEIGKLSSEVMETLNGIKNPFNSSQQENEISFLKIFQDTNKNLEEIALLSADLEENLNKVNSEDIPEDKRKIFVEIREELPEINSFIKDFSESSDIFTDILGGNGPRKYLFLFQNNNEMRATGGFIGTYGVMDIFNGRVKKFYIDGIFNPDGQLSVNVVPPAPIQKISGVWTLHDSNWFPDFPKSAEKAIWFFEKTGGPTVDGVITMTPEMMIKLLEITGPIEMEEYGITVDKDNFVEKIQEEVENNYDRKLNQPKKVLADLAPKILDKIFNAQNISDVTRTLAVLEESLNEKHIILYSSNYQIEKEISERGWSGEILKTQKDYISVINSNINGYKTDGVVDEKIEHVAEIQPDGSIVDTVTITRRHNGGNYDYDWFNKVNADYMRVYVPEGSELISAEGQSREFNSPPLDYDSLNFKRDPQVQMEENSIEIDEKTGTRIYKDSGKTVFANWVYVSPQETVVMKYKYLLPFKISFNSKDKLVEAYSLLAQKQAGSRGSRFDSKVIFPENYKVVWQYPDEIEIEKNEMSFSGNLKKDKFIGVAFQNQ